MHSDGVQQAESRGHYRAKLFSKRRIAGSALVCALFFVQGCLFLAMFCMAPSNALSKKFESTDRSASSELRRERMMGLQRSESAQGPVTRMQRGGRSGRGGPPMTDNPFSNRSDYPMWEIPKGFNKDVFVFVRIQFDSFARMTGRGQGWNNDYPDCDWNFSTRLQELTAYRVDPHGKVLRFSDPELFDLPISLHDQCRRNFAERRRDKRTAQLFDARRVSNGG